MFYNLSPVSNIDRALEMGDPRSDKVKINRLEKFTKVCNSVLRLYSHTFSVGCSKRFFMSAATVSILKDWHEGSKTNCKNSKNLLSVILQ